MHRPCRVLLLISLVLCLTMTWHVRAELRTVRTRHYRIHTDLEQALTDDLAKRMDAMYEEYSRRLALFAGATAQEQVFDVYVFQRKDDYLRLTGRNYHNSGGIFIPSRNLLAAYFEGQGRNALRQVLQHEAFHQFAHTAIGPGLPAWLNEGMAKYFEDAIWTGRDFLVGEVPPSQARRLRQDLSARRLTPFDQLMAKTQHQWNDELAHDVERGYTNYNQAWAMVHFLVNAADEQGKPKYRARLLQMLRLIGAGTDAAEAFTQSFGTNVKGFEDRFAEWAKALRPTRRAQFLESQTILAHLLVELADRGTRFEQMSEFRDLLVRARMRLQYTKGQFTLTSAEDPESYFRDTGGRLMDEHELFFSLRAGAPLPDMVCRFEPGLQARTRFYLDPSDRRRIEHETLIEPAR